MQPYELLQPMHYAYNTESDKIKKTRIVVMHPSKQYNIVQWKPDSPRPAIQETSAHSLSDISTDDSLIRILLENTLSGLTRFTLHLTHKTVGMIFTKTRNIKRKGTNKEIL